VANRRHYPLGYAASIDYSAVLQTSVGPFSRRDISGPPRLRRPGDETGRLTTLLNAAQRRPSGELISPVCGETRTWNVETSADADREISYARVPIPMEGEGIPLSAAIA